jgi:hypothetical protein
MNAWLTYSSFYIDVAVNDQLFCSDDISEAYDHDTYIVNEMDSNCVNNKKRFPLTPKEEERAASLKKKKNSIVAILPPPISLSFSLFLPGSSPRYLLCRLFRFPF